MFKRIDSLRETRDYARENSTYKSQWYDPRRNANTKDDKKEK